MLLSIIIPAKNEEKNIGLCLSAISELVGHSCDLEVIVVDNGSTDNTVKVVNYHGYKAFTQPELSLSGLRNFGAEAAKGEILAFLDADCLVAPDWLTGVLKNLSDPSIGCTGSTPAAPENGPWVERIWAAFRTRRHDSCYSAWINSSNFIIKSQLFNEIGGFNEHVKTCEDVDICMRLKGACKILFDPAVRVIHLGEPKTCWQFFKKEVWRGKGTLSGIVSHGFVFSELKSLLLPLYYLTVYLVTLLISFSVLATPWHLVICILFYVAPAIVFGLWSAIVTRRMQYFFGYVFLFILYANARTLALFPFRF